MHRTIIEYNGVTINGPPNVILQSNMLFFHNGSEKNMIGSAAILCCWLISSLPFCWCALNLAIALFIIFSTVCLMFSVRSCAYLQMIAVPVLESEIGDNLLSNKKELSLESFDGDGCDKWISVPQVMCREGVFLCKCHSL